MVVHYYRIHHLPEDYELVPDWNFDLESPERDSDHENDIDIDGPDHTKDYMAWWREHHPDHIGIHAPNLAAEEEVVEEDTPGTQDGWNATNTRLGWDRGSDYEV